MQQWTDQPAVVIGRYRDVLAANDLAGALNPGFRVGTNLLRHAFLEPSAREIYLDWDEVAREGVAGLRATAGTEPQDPRLIELVGELALRSDAFRGMLAEHHVHRRTAGTKQFDNPLVGPITVDYQTFAVNGTDGQTLFVFSAAPGSADDVALRLLATVAPGGPQRSSTVDGGRTATAEEPLHPIDRP